jgi:RNA polymerase sigma-70 factor (ECF subfamily)
VQEGQKQLIDWIEMYTEELISWCIHKISDPETAKDLVQDTFLAVAKNLHSFKGKSNPKTWIFSILNNKISDHYRRKYKQSSTIDYDVFSSFFNEEGEWITDKQPQNWENDDVNLLDDREFLKVLSFCIENLPDRFNAVVMMKYYGEKKSDDICKELDISTTNMWQIMHRAKLKLRECIENGWFKK